MELEIHVDRDRCMGSGQCVWQAPGVFDQDDRAISVVVDPRGDPEEKIVKAVTSCPVMAISLRVGGVGIRAEDLWQWQRGAAVDDPLVGLLVQLSDDHDRLREDLATVRRSRDRAQPAAGGDHPGRGRVSKLVEALASHLSFEDEQIYPRLAKLLGEPVVAAFDQDHRRMTEAILRLGGANLEVPIAAGEIADLADAIDDHIRIEETVLFPLALGALHRVTVS